MGWEWGGRWEGVVERWRGTQEGERGGRKKERKPRIEASRWLKRAAGLKERHIDVVIAVAAATATLPAECLEHPTNLPLRFDNQKMKKVPVRWSCFDSVFILYPK